MQSLGNMKDFIIKRKAVYSWMHVISEELWWIKQQPSASQHEADQETVRRMCSRVHICGGVYVKVSEGSIDMLYSQHMEQQQQEREPLP